MVKTHTMNHSWLAMEIKEYSWDSFRYYHSKFWNYQLMVVQDNIVLTCQSALIQIYKSMSAAKYLLSVKPNGCNWMCDTSGVKIAKARQLA